MSGKYFINSSKNIQNQQKLPMSNNHTYGIIKEKNPITIKENLNKNEIMEYKRLAQEKLRLMDKRKKCAIRIQKVWRGYVARKKFKKIKPKLMQALHERLVKQKRREYIKKNAKMIICNAIYRYVLKKRAKQKYIMKKFFNHCATIIQKHVRGYLCYKKYKILLSKVNRLRYLIEPVVQGFKIRKIFTIASVKNLKKEIKDLIKELNRGDKRNNSKKNKDEIINQIKLKRTKLVNTINNLYNTGFWVHHLARKEEEEHQQESRRQSNQDPRYTHDRNHSFGNTENISRGYESNHNDEINGDKQSKIDNDDYCNSERNRQNNQQDWESRRSSAKYNSIRNKENYHEEIKSHPEEFVENNPSNVSKSNSISSDRDGNYYNRNQIRPSNQPNLAQKKVSSLSEKSKGEDSERSLKKSEEGNNSSRKLSERDQYISNRQPNAWDERENMPIGGKNKGYYYDDVDENPGNREVNEWEKRENMPIKGRSKGYSFEDEMEKPENKEPNEWDKSENRPIGGKGKYDYNDADEQPNNEDLNEWEKRENKPIGGRKKYDYNELDEQQNNEDMNKREKRENKPARGRKKHGYNEEYEQPNNEDMNEWEKKENKPIRGKKKYGYNEADEQQINEDMNEWEKKENKPIGGKKKYGYNEEDEQPQDEEMNEWEKRENKPIGGKKKYGFNETDEHPNNEEMNEWEKRENKPIGGKNKYNYDEEDDQSNNKEINEWEKRESMPIGGKKFDFTEQPYEEEAKVGEDGAGEDKEKKENKVKKATFLKKKVKYDPRKAIEEAKAKNEAGITEKHPNIKKSEELRELIKFARGESIEDTNGPMGLKKENGKKTDQSGKKDATDSKIKEEPENKTNEENNNPDEGKKCNFLKRKSKAVQFQKLKWKGQSRIDCWTRKDGRNQSRSPSPEERKINPVVMTKVNQVMNRAKSPLQGGGNAVMDAKQIKNNPKMIGPNGNVNAMRPNTSMGQMQTMSNNNLQGFQNTMKNPPNPAMRPMTMQNHIQGPSNHQNQQQQSHVIQIDELEKAFNFNFLAKYANITGKFYAENGIRDPKYKQSTSIPIIKLNSYFISSFRLEDYQELMAQYEEHYKALQTLN